MSALPAQTATSFDAEPAAPSAIGPVPARLRTGSLIAAYVLITLAVWGYHAPFRGMSYETAMVYLSEARPWYDGFVYPDDRLRPFNSTLYHVAYLLGLAMGFFGGFLSYELVYAAVRLGCGLAAFGIVRRLAPGSPLLAVAAGAATLAHASDRTLNWVGQLNQLGVAFWTLLSFYFLLRAAYGERTLPRVAWAVLAAAAAVMSLGSHEVSLPLIASFPFLVLVAPHRPRRPFSPYALASLLVPAAYAVRFAKEYLNPPPGQHGYQLGLLRAEWSPSSLAADLAFNVGASLSFWRWPDAIDARRPVIVPVIAASVAVAALLWAAKRVAPSSPLPPVPVLLRLLGLGVAMAALSFPGFVALAAARSQWRTHILSGFGAALALTAAAALLAWLVPAAGRRHLFLVAMSLPLVFGIAAATKAAEYHYQTWELQRMWVARILQAVPKIRPGTVIVLTNVPPEGGADPFQHAFWFDLAMRLAYPNTPLGAVFLYEGGEPGPGWQLRLKRGRWRVVQGAMGTPLVTEADVRQTLVIALDRSGRARVSSELPPILAAQSPPGTRLDPNALVEPGPPSPVAVRRYVHPY